MVLEKTLESPWTARRAKQSILKEISPGCSFMTDYNVKGKKKYLDENLDLKKEVLFKH